MVRCKNCKDTFKTCGSDNFIKWQLCYPCAIIVHPGYYKEKRKHGTGGTYLKEPEIPLLMS